jgi:hypothetical protein
VYQWFIDLGAHQNIITDGSTRKLETLIVTTIAYHCSREQKSIWLDRGSTIRKQTGMPWIVLHHVPPKNGSGACGEEIEAAELLAVYRPDYFVSGHNHSFPYASGQCWNRKADEVCLLNPGHCSERRSRITSRWTPNQGNSRGIPQARRGYRRTGCTIIWC